MKILYVYFHNYDDMPYHTREWVEAAVELGHEVTVLTAIDPAFLRGIGWDDHEGVKVVQVAYPSGTIPFLRFFLLVRRFRRALKKLMADFPPDLVYERYSRFAKAGSGVCFRLPVPYGVEVNGIIDEQLKMIKASRCRQWFANWIQQYVYDRSDYLVAVTDNIKTWLTETYRVDPDKIAMIQNGVNTRRFSPKDKSAARGRFEIPEEKFVVGYLGSLVPWQNIPLLIESASALIEQIPEIHFLIGGGQEPMKSELIQAVEEAGWTEYFTFSGQIHWDDAATYISCFDLAVAPIKYQSEEYEISPLKLASYMACACPIVASDVPGQKHYLIDSGAGRCYNMGSAESFQETLLELYRTPAAERHRAGVLGREYAEQHFDWRKLVAETLSFINKEEDQTET